MIDLDERRLFTYNMLIEYGGTLLRKGLNSGQLAERNRIIGLARDGICFDYQRNLDCSHPGCRALNELIELIKETA